MTSSHIHFFLSWSGCFGELEKSYLLRSLLDPRLWKRLAFSSRYFVVCVCAKVASVMSNSLWPHGLRSSRFRDPTQASRVSCTGRQTLPLAPRGKPHFVVEAVTFRSVLLLLSLQVPSDSSRPRDHSTPGFPVPLHLPEFTQVRIHCIGDAIQPSHPLLSPSPPAHSPSQQQGLFHWVSSSHQVARVLELQLLCQSFQWVFRVDFL